MSKIARPGLGLAALGVIVMFSLSHGIGVTLFVLGLVMLVAGIVLDRLDAGRKPVSRR